jgi:hypothetical protein
LADKATRMAIRIANDLNVPFVANGDTTDSKALLRAECVNAMIETFKTAKLKPYVSIGNHCKINSRSIEHALNFLEPYVYIVDTPRYITELKAYVIPYHEEVAELRQYLKTIPSKSTLIMHQGLEGSNMGDYVKDSSALCKEDLAQFRTILSHYHRHQDINCSPGLATYIGSPYSITFGEALDGPKGFGILMDDGSLEFVPTNLRKHVILEVDYRDLCTMEYHDIKLDDLVWMKITGSKAQLSTLTKQFLKDNAGITQDFRLDLIPDDIDCTPTEVQKSLSQPDLLDGIIDSATGVDTETKTRLKTLWREL